MIYKILFLSLAASIQAAPITQGLGSRAANCPTDGAIICSPDGNAFYMCNFGKAVPMGAVAAGMTCKDGNMIALDSSFTAVAPPSNSTSELPTGNSRPAPVPVETNQPNPPAPTSIVDDATTTMFVTVQDTVKSSSTIVVTVLLDDAPTATTVASVIASNTVIAPSTPTESPVSEGGGLSITTDIILQVAPNSASCANAEFPDECGTAEEAAPFINAAFSKYNIKSIGEAAAILSIVAFESGGLQFNKNHFPGRPGQGTKAMLMPGFILSYAKSLEPENPLIKDLDPATFANQSPDLLNQVLGLVLGDDRTYASASWFYSENCSGSVKAGLQASPSVQAWSEYITNCVGTTITSDRQAGFEKAVAALGGSF